MRRLWRPIEHGYLKPALRRLKPFTRPIELALRPLAPWRQAEFGGIHVHYKRHLDGGGTSFGQDYLALLNAWHMPRQHRVFEWCSGPGFIGFSLLGHGLCDSLCLADLNPGAVEACRRTVADNQLGDRVAVYHSDNLKRIPEGEQWDLVVGNPPHFIDDFAGDIRGHDPGWRIHREFFGSVGRFLKPGGLILLQENNRGSTVGTFRAMIEEAGLSIAFSHLDAPQRTPRDRFYYVAITRQGQTPPPWALSRPVAI